MEREGRLIQPQRITGALVKILFAWVYSLGISRVGLELLNLPVITVEQGLAMLLFLLVLAVLTWQRYSLLAFGSFWLILLGLAFLYQNALKAQAVLQTSKIQLWLEWAMNYFLTGSNNGNGSLQTLALVICLLTAVLAYITLARFNGPGTSLLILLLIGSLQTLRLQNGLFWILLAGCPVIATIARSQKRTFHGLNWLRYPAQANFMLQSLPIAAIALSLALAVSALLPASAWQSQLLISTGDNFKNDLTALVRYNAPGTGNNQVFSIADAGYYPLENRLGGPVSLSDHPVMQVSGYPQPMLLRGSVRTTYDGQRWLLDKNSQLLRFDSDYWAPKRSQVFNQYLPDYDNYALNRQDLSVDANYTLTPVEQAIRIVFLAGRPISMITQGRSADVYFDEFGHLFYQPSLEPGQNLLINTSLILTASQTFTDSAERIRQNLAPEEQSAYVEICSRYLPLPDLAEYAVNGELRPLTAEIIYGARNPWDQAQQIKAYLQDTCQYNLVVAVPPENADFVSWFLQTKEGYCVYFASAMTMLCRIAGIPARYVEGYYVQGGNSADESRLVTTRQAHAWTEIYLAGIGWIPIDATPGGQSDVPITTPSPTPTVTPTPTANPLSPTPSSSVKPSAPPTGDPIQDFLRFLRSISPWWLLCLLILPLLYLIRSLWWYKKRHQRAWLQHYFADDRLLAIHYWQEILELLRGLGFRGKLSETPRLLIERVLEETTWLAGRRRVVESMLGGAEKALFSQELPTDTELDDLADLRGILEKTLQQNSSRLLFLLRRICYHKPKRGVNY
jgi:transglutaminase-like putative cysteine protease